MAIFFCWMVIIDYSFLVRYENIHEVLSCNQRSCEAYKMRVNAIVFLLCKVVFEDYYSCTIYIFIFASTAGVMGWFKFITSVFYYRAARFLLTTFLRAYFIAQTHVHTYDRHTGTHTHTFMIRLTIDGLSFFSKTII